MLAAHAHTHALTYAPFEITGVEIRLCEGLSDAQLRHCPEGRHNSIAWLLWHMARCEDVMVNTILRGVTEVLDEGWLPRLCVSTRHIGTDDTMADVETFSQEVDVQALRAYRLAVAQSTHTWFATVEWSSLQPILKREAAERAVQRGALRPEAMWVFEELGEAFVTRGHIISDD
jgi:hypothetical protein